MKLLQIFSLILVCSKLQTVTTFSLRAGGCPFRATGQTNSRDDLTAIMAHSDQDGRTGEHATDLSFSRRAALVSIASIPFLISPHADAKSSTNPVSSQ